MDFFEKVKGSADKLFKSLEESIEIIEAMDPKRLDNAISDFDNDTIKLKNKISQLESQIAAVKTQLEERRQLKKDLIKKLKKNKV